MGMEVYSHTEWCIVRFANGRFERVREGYKSAANASRGIPFVVKADIADGIVGATYSVGYYSVGSVITQGGFRRYCA